MLAWASLLFWGWQAIRERLPVHVPRKDLAPLGVYDAVEGVTGPASVRLKGLGKVLLAGLAEPEASEARAAAGRRLGDLAPPGTPVYVEPEWPASDDGGGFASVFLRPPDARADRPFPYADASLLGAVLVREGLARVDPAAPYRYRAEFLMLEDDARRHRRGLWAGR
ncbi:MAG: thermonuclease family protein [Planctomycetota bacterium]|nr:thermonuclease family protein [Planctomycetota bacterium]